MANFKTYDPRRETSGPGRVALSGGVLSGANVPDRMQDIMDPATYAFKTTSPELWDPLGATTGGITPSKGFAETELSHDLSEGAAKTEVTGHTATCTCTLVDTGNIELFKYAWMAETATNIVNVSTPTFVGRQKGIAAKRVKPQYSCSVVEIDEAGLLRAFYLRTVEVAAGDVPFAITPGAWHTLQLNLKAFADTSFADAEFGFILESDGFGGFTNP